MSAAADPFAMRLHHAALSVSDLDASIAFYTRFGFEEAARSPLDDGAFALLRDANGGALELFAFPGAAPYPSATLGVGDDLRTQGVRHVAFETRDLDALAAELAHRYDMAPLRPRTPSVFGYDYMFYRDPDGILIEFIETRTD